MSSTQGGPAPQHSPPAPVPDVLDNTFLTFLLTQTKSPGAVHPGLQYLMRVREIERHPTAADRLTRLNSLFFDVPAEILRSSIPHGSAIKEKLRAGYPLAFARIWPGEAKSAAEIDKNNKGEDPPGEGNRDKSEEAEMTPSEEEAGSGSESDAAAATKRKRSSEDEDEQPAQPTQLEQRPPSTTTSRALVPIQTQDNPGFRIKATTSTGRTTTWEASSSNKRLRLSSGSQTPIEAVTEAVFEVMRVESSFSSVPGSEEYETMEQDIIDLFEEQAAEERAGGGWGSGEAGADKSRDEASQQAFLELLLAAQENSKDLPNIHKSDMNLLGISRQIGVLCWQLNAGKFVSDTAKHICKLLADAKAMKGEAVEAIIAGCISIACRHSGVPRTVREISSLTNASEKELGRICKHIEVFLGKLDPSVKEFIKRCARDTDEDSVDTDEGGDEAEAKYRPALSPVEEEEELEEDDEMEDSPAEPPSRGIKWSPKKHQWRGRPRDPAAQGPRRRPVAGSRTMQSFTLDSLPPPPADPLPLPSPEIVPDFTAPVRPVEVVDDDELLRGVTGSARDGWEWNHDMEFKVRQPPLAIRLEHVLNFLREEDVYRSLKWNERWNEVQEFVAWLEKGDGRALMQKAGPVARNMFVDVKRMIAVHKHFEAVKTGPVQIGEGIRSVEEVPKPTRGKRPVIPNARAIAVGEPEEDDGPRRLLVAKPERIHTQFAPTDSIDNPRAGEADLFLRQFNAAEKAFWTMQGKYDPAFDYLFRLENAAYEVCAASPGPLSRFKTRDGQGELILPADEQLPANSKGGPPETVARQAVERGARRAALQQALRCFTNSEQILATTGWNRLVPAVEQRVLDEVRKDLDRNHQWALPQMSSKTVPVALDKLETMPYTVWWRENLKMQTEMAERVRKMAEEKHSKDRGWVTLPMGVTYGGPFVWRMVDPDVQSEQDLLKECEEVFKAIIRTPRVATERHPIPLLDEVERCATKAAEGKTVLMPNQVPSKPGDDAWKDTNHITSEELKWLRFLTSKSVNEEMLLAAAAAGQKRPKLLYSIFATRLEKAMDDRSKAALFLAGDRWRTVEELLEVINRGCDGVTKVVFSPFQAKYFLERAAAEGLCTYKPDPTVYGHIARSIRDMEPLDRVQGDICSFHHVLASGKRTEQDEEPYVNFFVDLGLRLGITLYRLRRRKREWKSAQPLATQHLQDALNTYREMYAKVQGSSQEVLTPAQFVRIVDPATWEKIIPETVSTIPDEEWTMDKEDEAHEVAALKLIRKKLIHEAHANLSLLGRGRQKIHTRPDGEREVVLVRDFNWDWASVEVRGKKRQFFSLDRWPLGLQSEKTRERIKRDEGVDERYVVDAVAEDPVPKEYFAQRLGRFERERVRRRAGPAVYPIGDTALQRRVIMQELQERIGGPGITEPQKPRTWRETLAGLIGARRSRSPENEDVGVIETSLPEVDPALVPGSWTPPRDYPVVETSLSEADPALVLASGTPPRVSPGSRTPVDDSDSAMEEVEEEDETEEEDVPMKENVG